MYAKLLALNCFFAIVFFARPYPHVRKVPCTPLGRWGSVRGTTGAGGRGGGGATAGRGCGC
jgi:hypothetical protein